MDAETASARHIFLDVVGFTRDRSVEAQTAIVAGVNAIVSAAVAECGVPVANRILIPTGDGLCISILDYDKPFDLHLQLAADVLCRLAAYNVAQHDEMRQYQVRIGITKHRQCRY